MLNSCVQEGERGGEAEESRGHLSLDLRRKVPLHSLPALVGERGTLMVFSLLYPIYVFLSIPWALDLEMERASSGKEFFKELLFSREMKLRI